MQRPFLPLLQRVLLGVAAVGFALFAGLAVLSVIEPTWIERAARGVLQHEVERRVGERIDRLTDARVLKLAQKALGQTDAEIAIRRQALRAELPQRTAHAMADLLKADCECRKRMVESAEQIARGRIESLEEASAHLARLIEAGYGEVSRQLLRELRIFCAVNALAFALLGVLTFKRRVTTLQLLLPAAAVIGAAALAGALYLFGQNWLHTILFGSYVGWAYLAWYGLALAWLVDLLCNRARVTGALLQSVGCLGSSPC